VDDEPVIHALLQKGLQKYSDCNVTSVDSFEQGLRVFIDGSFDLLLIDRNLRGQSGVDLVRQIRQIDPLVGVAMITGEGSLENAIEMLHLDVDRYIEKPFGDMKELAAVCGEIIEKARVRRGQGEPLVARRDSIPAPRTLDPKAEHLVLVVSPLKSEREWIGSRLEDRCRIRQAPSSGEAIASIEQSPPDIVIVDMNVHEPDVFQFIEHLNETVVGLNVAVISHKLAMEDVKRFIELDVAALFRKPLKEDEFRKLMGPLL
jgi:DNA-binding NtrC family response regulator